MHYHSLFAETGLLAASRRFHEVGHLSLAAGREPVARHAHAQIEGGKRSKLSEIYTPLLVDTILKGLLAQLKGDSILHKGEWRLDSMEIGVHVDE